MNDDLLSRLRNTQMHTAEAHSCEEYLPMKGFWSFYSALSLDAADKIAEQIEAISSMKAILQEVLDESIALEYSEGGDFLVDKAVIEKIESFLS